MNGALDSISGNERVFRITTNSSSEQGLHPKFKIQQVYDPSPITQLNYEDLEKIFNESNRLTIVEPGKSCFSGLINALGNIFIDNSFFYIATYTKTKLVIPPDIKNNIDNQINIHKTMTQLSEQLGVFRAFNGLSAPSKNFNGLRKKIKKQSEINDYNKLSDRMEKYLERYKGFDKQEFKPTMSLYLNKPLHIPDVIHLIGRIYLKYYNLIEITKDSGYLKSLEEIKNQEEPSGDLRASIDWAIALLDVAIAQETLLIGDVLLPEILKILQGGDTEFKESLKKTIRKLPYLKENLLLYYLKSKYDHYATNYFLAYCTVNKSQLVSLFGELDFQHEQKDAKSGCPIWTANLYGLRIKMPPPSFAKFDLGEFAISEELLQLIAIRQRLFEIQKTYPITSLLNSTEDTELSKKGLAWFIALNG